MLDGHVDRVDGVLSLERMVRDDVLGHARRGHGHG